MVFEISANGKDLSPYQKKFTLKEVITRLTMGGLETAMFYSAQSDEVYVKIRCPLDRLKAEADRIDYKLLLEQTTLRSACANGRPGVWEPINIVDEFKLCKYDPYQYIYAPYSGKADRPDVECLYTRYGSSITRTPFRGVDRMKLIYSILTTRAGDGGCNLDVVRLMTKGCILGFYPLHEKVELRELEQHWLNFFQAPWKQPISAVKDYFGEKVALYFTWLGHYTTWLIPASILGVLAWAHVAYNGNDPNVWGTAVFSVFIMVWSTMFTEFWKRKESNCTMKWGTIGYEEGEQTRPQFKGERGTDPVDGSPMDYFPKSEARQRLTISYTVIFGLICVVIVVIASIFILKNFLADTDRQEQLTAGGVNYASIIPALVNAIQIIVMNYIYSSVALKLNKMENHRTDTEFEDNLILKTFLFQFVNSYASLFYIAFIKPRDEVSELCIGTCMGELATNLGTIFLTRLAVGNLTEIGIPLLKSKKKAKDEMKGTVEGRTLSEAEKEFIKEDYDVMLGTFDDYAEMVIQYGYATLFVPAFPLSSLMAFVNNYIEIRVDAYKLLNITKRPEPRSVEDIGSWATILEVMSAAAVVCNAALIAFTSELFADKSTAYRVWVFLGIEHAVFGMKYIIMLLIPDVPQDVQIQLKRNEFLVSKIIDNVPDDDDTDLIRSAGKLADFTIKDGDDDQ
ncbi:unnamed protein product [Chrysoparadoxa australica]